MIYVALLRGINVGGNSKVSMSQLKAAFERLGLESVKTYINSGNVIFRDDAYTPKQLVSLLESTIEDEFGFPVKVLIRDFDAIKKVVDAIPDSWKNDTTMKCDVMFLWEEVDNEKVLDELVIKPGIDTVRYIPGTILFAVDRANVTRSGLTRIIGTPLYKMMTLRNCNTTRKLYEIMKTI